MPQSELGPIGASEKSDEVDRVRRPIYRAVQAPYSEEGSKGGE